MAAVSALLVIVFGLIVAAISLFLPPQGEIDGSVLMLNGQVLVYAGSIFGVRIYIKDLVKRIERSPPHALTFMARIEKHKRRSPYPRGCGFFGSISGEKTTCCGGLTGWNNGAALTVENCVVDGYFAISPAEAVNN